MGRSRVILLIGTFALLISVAGQAANFVHPSDIVKSMQAKFKTLKTYQADFSLDIKENNKTRVSRGVASYSEGAKLNFTFTQPYGDIIVSNGEKLFVYVARLNAVGRQSLKTRDKSGKSLLSAGSSEGLTNLFKRYHYKFDKPEQPREIEGQKYFVLDLKEKEISGGYDKILLFVDAQSFIIKKMKASSPSGRQVELQFSNIRENPPLDNKLFQFKEPDNAKTVDNPLTTE